MTFSPITSANFRSATPEEIEQARGGVAQRCVKAPLDLFLKSIGTLDGYFKGLNSLDRDTPLPQRWLEGAVNLIKPDDNLDFMHRAYSFFGDYIYLTDSTMIKAFLEYYRNDIKDLFANSESFQELFQTLKKTFPEDKFTKESFILTCSPENSLRFHTILLKLLNPVAIAAFRSQLDATIKTFLANWETELQTSGPINITQETRLFASSIITQLLFGTDASSKELSEAVSFINLYLKQQRIGKTILEDDDSLNYHVTMFRSIVENFLKEEKGEWIQSNDFSQTEKKALIFGLFMAGREPTASLLNYIIWQLAMDSDNQNSLYTYLTSSEYSDGQKAIKMKSLFNQFINEFTPATEIARKINQDICLEYQLQGQEETRKTIFYKNSVLGIHILTLAEKTLKPSNYNDWFAFGEGPHRCPGENLALQMITRFFTRLVSEYQITTEQKEEIPRIGYLSLQLAEDVFITLQPRVPPAAEEPRIEPDAQEVKTSPSLKRSPHVHIHSSEATILASIDLEKFQSANH